MTTSLTDRSTLRLSEVARHVVYPKGIKSTAWPRVVAKCAEMGVHFDEWQHGVGTLALGKDRRGKYAATVGGIVLSIPRQVGKTFLVGMIIIALCALNPGLTVLWTAHRTRTCTKTFQTLQGMVRRKKIWPLVQSIRTANGEQEIRFRNGAVIMFGAREQGFGRGFDEVDVEVFDEGQILTAKALEDMVAATNQSRQESGALLFFIGTPPRPSDPGEEFTNRRAKALDGKSTSMVYVEISADPDADLDDKSQWEKANPSFPHRTPIESMQRMRENLTDDDSFRREALGVWDPVGSNAVIPAPSWTNPPVADSMSMPVDRFALGVECGPNLGWASVCLAGQREDEDWHIEVEADQSIQGRGTAWLVPHLEHILKHNPQIRTVVADVGGPIAALLEQRKDRWFFRGTKLEVTPLRVAELGTACSRVLDGVVVGWLHHRDQPQMNAAALSAGKRDLGDTGMWVWSRKTAEMDITQIQAATLALHGAQKTKVQQPIRSWSNDGGAGGWVM